jgi:hypothetical protein
MRLKITAYRPTIAVEKSVKRERGQVRERQDLEFVRVVAGRRKAKDARLTLANRERKKADYVIKAE